MTALKLYEIWTPNGWVDKRGALYGRIMRSEDGRIYGAGMWREPGAVAFWLGRPMAKPKPKVVAGPFGRKDYDVAKAMAKNGRYVVERDGVFYVEWIGKK